MPRFKARRAEVRHLILPVAVAFEHLGGVAVHVRLFVVVRQNGRVAILLVHLRALLEAQPVTGNVLRVHLDDARERLGPVALGLAGQTVDQVERDVVKAGLARVLIGLLRLLEIVPPPDELEQIVVRGLHADRKAVHALLAQKLERVEAGRIGVAFDGDLAVDAHVSVELEGVEELGELVRAVKAGRAAAEIDAVHLIGLDRLGRFLEMIGQRLVIVRHQMLTARERIKVAVRAFACAERNMNVDSQLFGHRSKLQTYFSSVVVRL